MSIFKKTAEIWADFSTRLSVRLESAPIDTVALLTDFATTRSAFIAQKTLYGYLKTRMGTRYPSMFEDEVFVDSINIAKLHVFAACLSDLCIYTTAYALQHLPSDDSLRCRIARASFETGIANNREQVGSVEQFSASEATNAFDIRLRGTVWADAGAGWENFTVSPKALIEWAPIAPQLKRYDTEVVSNSIMFAWHGVREQFKKRVEPHKIAAEATGSDQT